MRLLLVGLLVTSSAFGQALFRAQNKTVASAAPAIVQSDVRDNVSCNGANTSSAICSNAISTTTGNLIHVFGGTSLGSGTIAVSDTAGNTYTCETTATQATSEGTSCYAKNITGNAANVVKFDFTDVNTCGLALCGLVVYEIANASTSTPLDVHQSKTNAVGVGTPCLSDSFSTGTANEVITMSCYTGYDGSTFSAGAITGTTGTLNAGGNDAIAGEYRAVTSTQSGTAAIGRSSGVPGSISFVMSYK